MSWGLAFVIACYVGIAFCVAGVLLWQEYRPHPGPVPEPLPFALAGVIALVVGLLWPVALLVRLAE